MTPNRFRVYVNYGRATPNVFTSELLSFAAAKQIRDMAKKQQTTSYGIILVDTERRLVEVSLGKQSDFEAANGFEQVAEMTEDA